MWDDLTYSITLLHVVIDVPIWKPVKCDPPLAPRAWHRAVVYNGAMYIFGGNIASGAENNVIRVAFSAL